MIVPLSYEATVPTQPCWTRSDEMKSVNNFPDGLAGGALIGKQHMLSASYRTSICSGGTTLVASSVMRPIYPLHPTLSLYGVKMKHTCAIPNHKAMMLQYRKFAIAMWQTEDSPLYGYLTPVSHIVCLLVFSCL